MLGNTQKLLNPWGKYEFSKFYGDLIRKIDDSPEIDQRFGVNQHLTPKS